MNIVSLSKNSGFDLSINRETNELIFGEKIQFSNPSVRMLSEASGFYRVPLKMEINKPLYFMYRGIALKEDLKKINDAKLRYDITVILSGTVGKEYIKTIGHLHPLSPLSNFTHTFTEVYSVIYGNSLYVLQKFSHFYLLNESNFKGQMIDEVIIIEANEGDMIFIPSHYGHTTINIGNKPLVMANILYSDFNSLYEPYQKLNGASYYVEKDMINAPLLNQNYKNPPTPKYLTSKDFKPPLLKGGKSLYGQFMNNLKELEFLYR